MSGNSKQPVFTSAAEDREELAKRGGEYPLIDKILAAVFGVIALIVALPIAIWCFVTPEPDDV